MKIRTPIAATPHIISKRALIASLLLEAALVVLLACGAGYLGLRFEQGRAEQRESEAQRQLVEYRAAVEKFRIALDDRCPSPDDPRETVLVSRDWKTWALSCQRLYAGRPLNQAPPMIHPLKEPK